MPIESYGLEWPDKTQPLQIELAMIRRLYFQTDKKKELLQHYLNAHKLLWPEDDQHRWFLQGMKSLVMYKISVFMGCASSNKTYVMAVHALIDYFAFPKNSLSLISSTEKRSLEMKVFGRVKSLFNRAKRRHKFIRGYVLESSMAITPDEIDDENEYARELTRGLICVPCISSGRFIGMGKFQGAKPPNSAGKNDGILKHYGDEAAVMENSFLDAYTNWMVNENFKGCMSGNPTDISDPLCTAGEPVDGWDSYIDNAKTQEWISKWYGAHVVAFDGRDTPNNDGEKKYPYLVSKEFVDSLERTHGADSWQLYQQGIGKPSRGMVSNRVITVSFCEKHKAFEKVVWRSTPTLRIGALDPAYGGGDRCIWTEGEIGFDVNGVQILLPKPYEEVQIKMNYHLDAEEQIAAFVKDKSDTGIPPENIFYDSFGRGTLGFTFAQKFGSNCPVPVNSGEKATARPVRFDLFVRDNDGQKRLKRCDEEYRKFVTELWFSVRELIQSEQMRELRRDVAQEGQMRMYSVRGSMIEVEPKDEMKERVKKSPDLFDTLAILVEGARQRGFKIKRIGAEVETPATDKFKWFIDRQRLQQEKRSEVALKF